jgi:hypothetical protein
MWPFGRAFWNILSSVSLVTEMEDLEADYPQLVRVLTKVRRTSTGEEYPFYVYRLQNRDNS